MRRRQCFTLLELMIVLFIISMVAGLTGFKIQQIYHEQRFFSESQEVLNHLSMAQDLMLMMDADIQVKIARDRQTSHFQIWLEVEKPFTEPWNRLIERKLPLSVINAIEFDEKNARNLTLQFSLGKMSKGVLVLYEGKKEDSARKFAIELTGYPAPFKSINLEQKGRIRREEGTLEKSQRLYPIEVYEKLYQETKT